MSNLDIEPIAGTLRESIEHLRPSEDSFLPGAVVDVQRALAPLTEFELQHLIVGAAAQIAARQLGKSAPADVMRVALELAERMSGDTWTEKTGPEIRRLTHEARAAAGLPDLWENEPDPEPDAS